MLTSTENHPDPECAPRRFALDPDQFGKVPSLEFAKPSTPTEARLILAATVQHLWAIRTRVALVERARTAAGMSAAIEMDRLG